VLISPAHHQIHHSAAPRHCDRNMGLVFALWDWAGGTLYPPDRRERLTYGLIDRAEGRAFSTVWQLYSRPVANLARRAMRGAHRQRRIWRMT
jgi:sterol desaturase/sphingolipid hydroxylase (fatty acid hydroxylase superfamily)